MSLAGSESIRVATNRTQLLARQQPFRFVAYEPTSQPARRRLRRPCGLLRHGQFDPGADTLETVARKMMRPSQGVLSHGVGRANARGERSGGHYERSKPSRRILDRNRRDRPARAIYPLSRDPRLDRSVGRYSRDSLSAGEVQAHLCLSLSVACPVDIGSANRSPLIPEIVGMMEGVRARPGSSEILAPY